MSIRTLFVTAALLGSVAVTGCATKPNAKKDVTQPNIVATTSESDPRPASAGAMDNSVIVGDNVHPSLGEASSIDESGSQKRLDTVYFNFDAYLLSLEARDTLARNARFLNESKLTTVIIEGHADEMGSDDYNLALAEKRAIAALRYLEALGVDQDRMKTISYGEDKPAVIGHDEVSWAKNRRVEFSIDR